MSKLKNISWKKVAVSIAAIAVVVSLWYLAVQLKQSTELAKADLEVQLGLTWADLHDNMIQNPNLARAYDLAEKNWDQMSDEDTHGRSSCQHAIMYILTDHGLIIDNYSSQIYNNMVKSSCCFFV